MSSYSTPLNIANRAIQHVGGVRISSWNQSGSREASEIAACYDNLREAELRRNVWRFSIREAILYPINEPLPELVAPSLPNTVVQTLPTLLLVPPVYNSTTIYSDGSIVDDGTGNFWTCTSLNVGQTPNVSVDNTWETYFGSMCIQPFNTTLNTPTVLSAPQSYNVGDLVYETTNNVTQVFVSLMNQNNTDPSTPSPWSSGQAYNYGQVVQDIAGWFWMSNIDMNANNMPGFYGPWSSSPTYAAASYVIGSDNKLYVAVQSNSNHNPITDTSHVYWTLTGYAVGSWPVWNVNTSYAASALVAGSDGNVYQSQVATNLGNNPVTDSGNHWLMAGWKTAWTPVFGTSTCGQLWNRVGGVSPVKDLNIRYPIGAGPLQQSFTRNVFKLPNGFLREAPDDPKTGAVSYIGSPGGATYKDWNLEGDYITSRTAFPITIRFVANIQKVSAMDPMFCELLSARVAAEVCEVITQSQGKFGEIMKMYSTFATEARIVNGIETGPTEAPEDDYITTRV